MIKQPWLVSLLLYLYSSNRMLTILAKFVKEYQFEFDLIQMSDIRVCMSSPESVSRLFGVLKPATKLEENFDKSWIE